MKKTKKITVSGFTVIELMISVAVIGIMIAASIVSLRSPDNKSRTSVAQRDVASGIELAQNYALQGKTQKNGALTQTPCGYGFIILDSTHYRIYCNFLQPGQGECQNQNADEDYRYYDPALVKSKIVYDGTLPKRVVFQDSDINNSIFFTVPTGAMYDGSPIDGFSGQDFASVKPAGLSINLTAIGDPSSFKSINIGTGGSIRE